jgi:hypothetical protein
MSDRYIDVKASLGKVTHAEETRETLAHFAQWVWGRGMASEMGTPTEGGSAEMKVIRKPVVWNPNPPFPGDKLAGCPKI